MTLNSLYTEFVEGPLVLNNITQSMLNKVNSGPFNIVLLKDL